MTEPEAVGFINVTRQCNVDCKRCYLTEANRAAKERLPLPTLERFFDSTFWIGRPVVLIWEGGEPSVVGRESMFAYCELARCVVPSAKQTMVTNCFNVPSWLIDLASEYYGGALETTYANGHKFSLAGDAEHYQRKFIEGLNRFWDAGIECAVNIELNAETIAAGTDALAKVILNSKGRVWEFDVSVDFRSFLAAPEYSASTVPVLPLTSSYREVWAFLSELEDRWGSAFKEAGIHIGAFNQNPQGGNNQFNVACESRFLTLNPDGTVTTNPLYSDLADTFLGNVNEASLDQIIKSKSRMARILADRTRALQCRRCQHSAYCKGGPSHVPVTDGSGECAGGLAMWNKKTANYINGA